MPWVDERLGIESGRRSVREIQVVYFPFAGFRGPQAA